MLDPEDVVFAWAIGKALLTGMVSIGALIYVAWILTRKMEITAHVGIDESGAPSSGADRANSVRFVGPERSGAAEGACHMLSETSSENNHSRKPEEPAAA